MKILGKVPVGYGKAGAIVHLSGEELSIISQGDRYSDLNGNVGDSVGIIDRFHKLIQLESAVIDATKTAGQLRGMASALDAVVAAAVASITPQPIAEPVENE